MKSRLSSFFHFLLFDAGSCASVLLLWMLKIQHLLSLYQVDFVKECSLCTLMFSSNVFLLFDFLPYADNLTLTIRTVLSHISISKNFYFGLMSGDRGHLLMSLRGLLNGLSIICNFLSWEIECSSLCPASFIMLVLLKENNAVYALDFADEVVWRN